MKIYHIFILFISALFLVSCDPDYDVTDYFDLEELPGYVAFDTDGNNATLDDFEVTEADGSVSLIVENPTGTVSNITVNYDLGGTAEFGTDYTISGASASGGSLTLTPNSGAVTETIRESIEIELLTDGVQDGEKTILVTLVDASNADGPLAVGRGGTEMLRTATVIISDVD